MQSVTKIVVGGGVIQEIHTNNLKQDIVVIDTDDLKETLSREEIEKHVDQAVEGLHEIPFDFE